jgi:hypothetical protein
MAYADLMQNKVDADIIFGRKDRGSGILGQ